MSDLADPVVDPALEAALRRAFRDEIDAIPLAVRAADVRAAASARAAARRRRVPIALAASIALVAVGVVATGLLVRSPNGVASPADPALSGLPAFDRLFEVSIQGHELARAEGVAGAEPTVVVVPGAAGFHPVEVVFTCAGSPLTLTAGDGGPAFGGTWGGPTWDCSGGASRTWIPGAEVARVATGGVRVEASPGTAWRVVVVGLPDRADVIAATTPVTGLPSFEELAAVEDPDLAEVARGSGTASSEPMTTRVTGLGSAVPMQSIVACTGGPLTLVWASGPEWEAEHDGGSIPCEGIPRYFPWNQQPAASDVSELHVYAPPGTAWVMLVQDSSGPGSPAPAP